MADKVDRILGQINSIINWDKTPSQVRAEEGIYTPSYNFSPEETYAIQAQWYANAWDNAMANAFWWLANDLGKYSTFANTSLGTADALLKYLQENESWLQRTAWNLYNQLTGDIQNQRDYIWSTFWPEGTLTQEVNKYYDDLWNYLATDAGRQAANIAAQWMHSGASLGSIRAQQNEAYNESFNRYVQAKEQEINAKQQIATNLINYMSTLRKEYWDTTNQYIIELYKRANDMYNAVAQSAAQDIDQYNMLRAQATWTWSWTTVGQATELENRYDNGVPSVNEKTNTTIVKSWTPTTSTNKWIAWSTTPWYRVLRRTK